MTSSIKNMPFLFVGHGSPMNIILKNSYTESLVRAAKGLPQPKAILVISAHWLTEGTFVTCTEKPKTIYALFLYNLASSVFIMRQVDTKNLETALKTRSKALKFLPVMIAVVIVLVVLL